MKLILNCGTVKDKLADIDLACEFLGTDADSLAQTKAFAVIQDLTNDPGFGTMGRRNDDAVNFSIAIHVLGYDPIEWFEALDDVVNFDPMDYSEMKDHLDRVHEYLDYWGPDGDKAKALDKLIQY